MHSALSALVLSLPLAALARVHADSALHRRHTAIAHSRRNAYQLTDHFQGQSFFDDWEFFNQADPTGGYVNFLDQQAASQAGLAYVQSDNTTVLAVDDTTQLSVGQNRNSVRISSKKSWNGGLFIADFFAMPHGCSVWPAFWMVSSTAEWPNGGEIDIIEGVNNNQGNQITLHSGADCLLNSTIQTLNSSITNIHCASSPGDDPGCSYGLTDPRTFGHEFNMQAGGVYALEWQDSGMTFWFFSRDDIPCDITDGAPDPTSWGTPVAVFPNTGCDMASHFFNQSLVIDTTLCGDWAGPAYTGSGCPGTCQEAVADPTNFSVAKWMINYISVYQ
ncbi:glycoside hydrolase family 16 protein [Gelatoporia subvermispora B]|uniref:Glycoside hydrolase family 16 protein n=1 Tax=Ceriporiopsis subvermispora (strain B) TaxID=914234 RepID=M2PRL5_CERS8|nr:glycoside hydrolase family 16 protein [Gelatoporia subvermispora B]